MLTTSLPTTPRAAAIYYLQPRQVLLLLPHARLLGMDTYTPGKYDFSHLPRILWPRFSHDGHHLLLRGVGHQLGLGSVIAAFPGRVRLAPLLRLHRLLTLNEITRIHDDLRRFSLTADTVPLLEQPADAHVATLQELARGVPRPLRRICGYSSTWWRMQTVPKAFRAGTSTREWLARLSTKARAREERAARRAQVSAPGP